MGKNAVGGHAYAKKQPIISPDFELCPGCMCFLSWRTLQRFVCLGGGGERNSFFCDQAMSE